MAYRKLFAFGELLEMTTFNQTEAVMPILLFSLFKSNFFLATTILFHYSVKT